MLVVCWIILFAMITGNFGKYLGIPYLFLDPEYVNHVGFTSFMIMGLLTAGFSMAFHITCYISDGHRFSFVGTLPRPFRKFVINNSLLPIIFLVTYLYEVIAFQINNENSTAGELVLYILGFVFGYLLMTILFSLYFRFTNKDIFKYMVCRIDEKIKQNVQVTRASALKKLDIARKRQVRVDYYIDSKLRVNKVEDTSFYDKATILQVFDQNHFNLVIIELLIFTIVLLLGIFKDLPAFQLPAAASFMIFLTIFVMMFGAFTYWFGEWSATMGLVVFLGINYLVGEDYFTKKYEAFGLDYQEAPAPYTVEALKSQVDSAAMEQDRQATLVQLNNWRKKFSEKPKMVFLCVSGGGKRAALWALNSLQYSDSVTHGKLMENSVLITGASGGLIGASYFRELKLRKMLGEPVNPYSSIHRNKISTDNLNPLIFSLLANDLFVGFTKFQYAGINYERDRAYTFEDQLNRITFGYLDKPITDYARFEKQGMIPLAILTPTVVNDGRKIYIASRPVSFMNYEINRSYASSKISGLDFQRFFLDHGAAQLRFLSALRMSATFPYITPNTSLPTEPRIQIMDAGISDNFGLSDAVRFLYAFKDWVAENTSGVVFVSIRDSPKLRDISPATGSTIVDDITQPISSVYNNFENFQDINSDLLIGEAHSWLSAPIFRIDIQYQAENYVPILQKMDSIRQNNARASLSWRLTTREKEGVINNVNSERNQQEIKKLIELLQ
ncbi:MAG: patatin-like phospholipase family protein [Bacteroidetes bacterium]|nr:patatin-like phospholipase family protein [Bacteroidota bacterium]MBI3482573.1 patatin-like phospholipase family protein [Bacteroidota bacterium]